MNLFWMRICPLIPLILRSFNDDDWDFICGHRVLDEKFLRKYSYKVNWNIISFFQNLSEDFISEFEDKVNWFHISKHQILS